MLPARFRLRDSEQIANTVRRGSRVGRRYLVVHYLPASARTSILSDMSEETGSSTTASAGEVRTHTPPQVGLTISKSVGGSVVRHRVARKLRHVVAGHVEQLPDGCSMVVRALPNAASATSSELDNDLIVLLSRVTPCG
ncbi:MAG: ribonuclease P protein component [Actinobacteria bacterium]|nr:ribonuclease P protein component [Actinomycetota bacterium]